MADTKIIVVDEPTDVPSVSPGKPLKTIPFFSGTGPSFQEFEKSISTWKTKQIPSDKGVLLVKINDGSDGNGDVAGKTFRIVRFVFNGAKTIYSTEKEY